MTITTVLSKTPETDGLCIYSNQLQFTNYKFENMMLANTSNLAWFIH